MQVRLILAVLVACIASNAYSQIDESVSQLPSVPAVFARVSASTLARPGSADTLHKLGFGGVVLRAPVTRADADAAQAQLSSAGITKLFLEVRLNVDTPVLADPQMCESLASRVGVTGELARRCAAQGLVIDCDPAGKAFDAESAAYVQANLDVSALSSAADGFGAALARSANDAIAQREVLLRIGDPAAISPLWWAFLDGFLSQASRIPGAKVYLLVQANLDATQPASLVTQFDGLNRMIRAQVGDAAWDAWSTRGGIVPILTARTASESPFAITAAKVLAASYVCCELETEKSNDLRDPPSVVSPIDHLVPIGSMITLGADVHVFSGEKGAAFIALGGLREPLLLRDRTLPVFVTNLWDNNRVRHDPVDGVVTVDVGHAPIFVEDLPIRNWAVPASIWAKWTVPVVAGTTKTPVFFGVTNCSMAPMAGTIAAVPPERSSVTPDVQTVNLQPGQRYEARGLLTGTARAGDTLSLKIVLGIPGAPAITRTFTTDVLPAKLWSANLRVPLPSQWIVADLNGDARRALIGVTGEGKLCCLGAQGGERWKSEARDLVFSAAVGRYWNDQRVVAAVDASGMMHLLSADGMENWQRPMGADPSTGPLFANLNARRGEELVVGLADGHVLALRSDGQPLWNAACEGPVRFITLADRDGDSRSDIVAVAGKGGDQLALIDARGEIIWQKKFPAPLSCAPLVFDAGARVAVGLKSGVIATIDASTGEVLHKAGIASAGIAGIAACSLEGRAMFVCAGMAGVYAVTPDLQEVWSAQVAAMAAPAVIEETRNAVVLVPSQDQGIVAFDARGKLLWRDTRAAMAATGSPLVVDLDGNGALDCVYASEDANLRAIEVPAR